MPYLVFTMGTFLSFIGALAGNPFGVDRQFIAEELGFFGGVCPNSMDAVSDRDFVTETLFFCSLHLVHLSRWAEDLIIYSSGAFKYVQCSDAYATGQDWQPRVSFSLQAVMGLQQAWAGLVHLQGCIQIVVVQHISNDSQFASTSAVESKAVSRVMVAHYCCITL